MDIYKRIAGIETEEEAEEMTDELIDRFGDIPESAVNLIRIARLRVLAHEVYLTEVAAKEKAITFRFYERAKIDPARIPEFLLRYDGNLQFRAGPDAPQLIYEERNSRGKVNDPIAFCAGFLKEMRESLLETEN